MTSTRNRLAAAVLTGTALLAFAVPGAAQAAAPSSAVTLRPAVTKASVDCDKYWSTASALRVRTGPSTGYATRGQLGYHNTVDIININDSGTWDEVVLLQRSTYGLAAGTVGWVSNAYMGIDNSCRTSINV